MAFFLEKKVNKKLFQKKTYTLYTLNLKQSLGVDQTSDINSVIIIFNPYLRSKYGYKMLLFGLFGLIWPILSVENTFLY